MKTQAYECTPGLPKCKLCGGSPYIRVYTLGILCTCKECEAKASGQFWKTQKEAEDCWKRHMEKDQCKCNKWEKYCIVLDNDPTGKYIHYFMDTLDGINYCPFCGGKIPPSK